MTDAMYRLVLYIDDDNNILLHSAMCGQIIGTEKNI